jgi:excisionase family DNA binding protein
VTGTARRCARRSAQAGRGARGARPRFTCADKVRLGAPRDGGSVGGKASNPPRADDGSGGADSASRWRLGLADGTGDPRVRPQRARAGGIEARRIRSALGPVPLSPSLRCARAPPFLSPSSPRLALRRSLPTRRSIGDVNTLCGRPTPHVYVSTFHGRFQLGCLAGQAARLPTTTTPRTQAATASQRDSGVSTRHASITCHCRRVGCRMSAGIGTEPNGTACRLPRRPALSVQLDVTGSAGSVVLPRAPPFWQGTTRSAFPDVSPRPSRTLGVVTDPRHAPALAEPLLTADEVSRLLGVPRASVYEYARRAHDPLPAVRVGRHVRFHRTALERWLANQQA